MRPTYVFSHTGLEWRAGSETLGHVTPYSVEISA